MRDGYTPREKDSTLSCPTSMRQGDCALRQRRRSSGCFWSCAENPTPHPATLAGGCTTRAVHAGIGFRIAFQVHLREQSPGCWQACTREKAL